MEYNEACRHIAERLALWKKAMSGDVDAAIELGKLILEQKDEDFDNEQISKIRKRTR